MTTADSKPELAARALPIDVLCHAVDQLMIRLTAGRLTTRSLSAAHAAHVAELMRAGYKYDEASQTFWDAVATARQVTEQEGQQ